MMDVPVWADYVTYNDDGYISGVRDDAPQEVKDAYNQYAQEQKTARDSNEFIMR